ncbi:GGDEF domain-containing protein [Halomonas sp. M1]|uniref:GGDEF domain-containing protein n=1 Tax=Halomonas sp. M1 TaxID=3035470 RepID=UPI0024853864|nr:GGDEF domain-containing protein [Halomonas sp. M1]WFE71667.1 GGDEF domain-containing protein [Halomonas sp. M1]
MKALCRPSIPWQLAGLLAVGVSICALLIASYVYNARQQLGADYTALVGDIVRAQQTTPQFQIALEGFIDQPEAIHLRQINHTTWLSRQYLAHVEHGLAQHPQLLRRASYLQNDMKALPEQLNALEESAQRAVNAPSQLPTLQRLATDLEANMAWVYFELNDVVHTAAGQQRLIMQRLSTAVSFLVAMVMLIAAVLLIAVFRLQRQRDTLKALMLTDELTGLYNRRHLIGTAQDQLTNAQRQQQPLSFLLIDLDYFKRVNDTFGHPIGDEVLRVVSARMKQLKRPADTLARIGGEEFCLLMPNTHLEDAEQVAERIRKEIADLNLQHIAELPQQTASIGISCAHDGKLSFEQIYSLADQALYQAKALGRDRVESMVSAESVPHSVALNNALVN